MLDQRKGFKYSSGAGFCASLASVFGKLAMNETFLHAWLHHTLNLDGALLTAVKTSLRLVFFVAIFLANAVMWNLFVKSMNYFGSVNAVVVNTACNFFFTAVFGYFCFREPLSLWWWLGASFIIIGVLLMRRGSPQHDCH
jgi:drug/metabolite transporter (DMT)-like permease